MQKIMNNKIKITLNPAINTFIYIIELFQN